MYSGITYFRTKSSYYSYKCFLEMIILNSWKKVKWFFCATLLACSFVSFPVNSDEEMEHKLHLPVVSEKTTADSKAPVINALAAVVVETSSGRVLYSKNATERRSIASTTKIMTAVVALENGNPDDIVTISKRAASIGGSAIGLQTGQEYTLKELLYAMLMNSANDAAVAIAEHIGGTVEGFAEMMNRKAKALGMSDSHYVTPHGLDAADQYSSAYDVAIITRHALKNPLFAEIVSTTSSHISGYSLYNTNELLGTCPGVDGVKTGYTGKAGRCLVTTAQRDGMRLISVVLGSPTRTARANASRDLLDYAYSNYSMYRLLSAGEAYTCIPVYRGVYEKVDLKASHDVVLPLSSSEAESLVVKEILPDRLNAPVYAGTDTGRLEYVLNGQVVGESMLLVSKNIRRKNYVDYLATVLKSWGRMMREGIFSGT